MKRSDFYKKLGDDMKDDTCFGLFIEMRPDGGFGVVQDIGRGIAHLVKGDIDVHQHALRYSENKAFMESEMNGNNS